MLHHVTNSPFFTSVKVILKFASKGYLVHTHHGRPSTLVQILVGPFFSRVYIVDSVY